MKAGDIARRAGELVAGDREEQHGDKLANHQAIAAIWNGYLLARVVSGQPSNLNAADVASLMELLKIARRLNGAFNVDDFIDAAGYAAVAGEIVSRHQIPSAPQV